MHYKLYTIERDYCLYDRGAIKLPVEHHEMLTLSGFQHS